MALTITDWIRRFASQGMTYDEIVEMLGATRIHVNNALNRRLSDGEPVQTTEPPCAVCGALRYHQEPSQRKRGRRCKLCGAHYKNWAGNRPKPVKGPVVEPAQASSAPAVAAAAATAVLHVPTWRGRPIGSANCANCGAFPSEARPNWRTEIKRKQRIERCGVCCAVPSNWRQRPKLILDMAEAVPVAKSAPTLAAASSLRQRFEERAKMPVRNLSSSLAEQQDEADRWLRDYEAKKQRQAPEAVGATGCDLQLPNKPGTRYQSGWDESPCPRAELIAQAVAGDEHARWRCKQLYGRELPA